MNEAGKTLESELRTPEQMEWILNRFKIDGLERLARSTQDYYDTHGNYLPDVAALAHAALKEVERLKAERRWLAAVVFEHVGTDAWNVDPEFELVSDEDRALLLTDDTEGS